MSSSLGLLNLYIKPSREMDSGAFLRESRQSISQPSPCESLSPPRRRAIRGRAAEARVSIKYSTDAELQSARNSSRARLRPTGHHPGEPKIRQAPPSVQRATSAEKQIWELAFARSSTIFPPPAYVWRQYSLPCSRLYNIKRNRMCGGTVEDGF